MCQTCDGQASDAAHVGDIAQLCYDIAGGEAFRAAPFYR